MHLPRLNFWFALAALISLLTLLAHAKSGPNALLTPVELSNLSPALKALVAILWHGLTATLAINTLALVWLARATASTNLAHPADPDNTVAPGTPPHRPFRAALALSVMAQFATLSGIFLYAGWSRLGSVWILPQWLAGLTVFLLCLPGILHERRPAGRHRP